MPSNTSRNTNIDYQNGPFKGIVMKNNDPANAGAVLVWIQALSGMENKDNSNAWSKMRYLSPFYGVTPHGALKDAAKTDFETNAHSYGMWFTAPDVGVEVLCMFAEGDPSQGYYMGFIPEQQLNHMIPAIGAQASPHFNNDDQEAKFGHAARVPVTEIPQTVEGIDNAEFVAAPKPVHSAIATQYWSQGLIADEVRGPIGSSSQRESPSNVFGISTPGRPIYKAGYTDEDVKGSLSDPEADATIVGRKGGHSFVMDDGDLEGNDKLVRIRTAGGHQIIMSDIKDEETIYISHSNGMSWIELGKEGTIDGYAANSVNFRTGGDINLHADKNVNINALDNINFFAGKNMVLEAEEKLDLTGKKENTIFSKTKLTVKSDGALNLDSSAGCSIKAGAKIDINGAAIGLNDGGGASGKAPKELKLADFDDVASDDGGEGWKADPGAFKSVVSRAPTHEPYAEHAKGIAAVKALK